jgi:hypothetical protein
VTGGREEVHPKWKQTDPRLQAIRARQRTIAVCQTSVQRIVSSAGNGKKDKIPTPSPQNAGISRLGFWIVMTVIMLQISDIEENMEPYPICTMVNIDPRKSGFLCGFRCEKQPPVRAGGRFC